MMRLSFFTYHVDEFMEAVAAPLMNNSLDEFRQLDRTVMTGPIDQPTGKEFTDFAGNRIEQHKKVIAFLYRRSFIQNHANVISASFYDRYTLIQELRDFLLAHTTQIEHNARFEMELKQQKTLTTAETTYFRWVRTISADHIAAPFCFSFAVCLIGATVMPVGNNDSFPSTMGKHLAGSLCRHLAIMCRMYSDIGSWARDRDEGNLNSLHFPEFGGTASDDSSKKSTPEILPQYERSCWKGVLRQLEEVVVNTPDLQAARLGMQCLRLI